MGWTETTAAARAKPGERPGGAVGREVNVMADIVALDQVKEVAFRILEKEDATSSAGRF